MIEIPPPPQNKKQTKKQHRKHLKAITQPFVDLQGRYLPTEHGAEEQYTTYHLMLQMFQQELILIVVIF